jgi:ubiquinone/menaquinone biosynthesis C-methylase UbiE
MGAKSTYNIIAPYYDWIMAHVDYHEWALYLRSLWEKHGLSPVKILELGAGTCRFFSSGLFPRNSFSIHTDLSPHMLNQPKQADNLKRAAADAAFLPFKSTFDMCLMIYDSFNYFLEIKDMERCLTEVYRVLHTGGLFIFDVTTEYNSRVFFEDTVEYSERENCTVIRKSWYDRKQKLQHNNFIYFISKGNGRYVRREEAHIQRIYSMGDMKTMISRSGFALLGCYDNLTFNVAGRDSERIHYVLQKQD